MAKHKKVRRESVFCLWCGALRERIRAQVDGDGVSSGLLTPSYTLYHYALKSSSCKYIRPSFVIKTAQISSALDMPHAYEKLKEMAFGDIRHPLKWNRSCEWERRVKMANLTAGDLASHSKILGPLILHHPNSEQIFLNKYFLSYSQQKNVLRKPLSLSSTSFSSY